MFKTANNQVGMFKTSHNQETSHNQVVMFKTS